VSRKVLEQLHGSTVDTSFCDGVVEGGDAIEAACTVLAQVAARDVDEMDGAKAGSSEIVAAAIDIVLQGHRASFISSSIGECSAVAHARAQRLLWKSYMALLKRWEGVVAASQAQEVSKLLVAAVLTKLSAFVATPDKDLHEWASFYAQRLSATLAYLGRHLEDSHLAGAYFALRALRGAVDMPHVVAAGLGGPGPSSTSAERFLLKSFSTLSVISPAGTQPQSQTHTPVPAQCSAQRIRYHDSMCDPHFAVYPPSRAPSKRVLRACASMGGAALACSLLETAIRDPAPAHALPQFVSLCLREFFICTARLTVVETGIVEDQAVLEMLVAVGDSVRRLMVVGGAVMGAEVGGVLVALCCLDEACGASLARMVLARVAASSDACLIATLTPIVAELVKQQPLARLGPAVEVFLTHTTSVDAAVQVLQAHRQALCERKGTKDDHVAEDRAEDMLNYLPLVALAARSDECRRLVQGMVCTACRVLDASTPPPPVDFEWELGHGGAVLVLAALARGCEHNGVTDPVTCLGKLGSFVVGRVAVLTALVAYMGALAGHLCALAAAVGTPATPRDAVAQGGTTARSMRALAVALRLWTTVLTIPQVHAAAVMGADGAAAACRAVLGMCQTADFSGEDCGAPSSALGHRIAAVAQSLATLQLECLALGMHSRVARLACQAALGTSSTTLLSAAETAPTWLRWKLTRTQLRGLGRTARALVRLAQGGGDSGSGGDVDVNTALNAIVPRGLMGAFKAMGTGNSAPLVPGATPRPLDSIAGLSPATMFDPVGALCDADGGS
jgi:hypothetical protein